jgi:magnesium chelatase subunit I
MTENSHGLNPPSKPYVRSLHELIDLVSGRSLPAELTAGDSGLAAILPFPFLAIVGQREMKLALLLSIINPAIGGVLLLGPRGTGKTTAVRSLLDLLPEVERSKCFYGCTPDDILTGGIDAVCPDCAKKYGEGLPLTRTDIARFVELPLNATLEDVIGGLDESVATNQRMRLKRGILTQADKNVLYVDETNLLNGEIINSILDAASQGLYTVRRGVVSATYNSRFILVGSMNPEEGGLRPQIMDRFGLRVIIRGLDNPDERLEAYRRVIAYKKNPRGLIKQYTEETQLAKSEIQEARNSLSGIEITEEIAHIGISLTRFLQIDSLRAEISLFEAAKAYTAMDGRTKVLVDDMKKVAPLALRLRRSKFMPNYLTSQEEERVELMNAFDRLAA